MRIKDEWLEKGGDPSPRTDEKSDEVLTPTLGKVSVNQQPVQALQGRMVYELTDVEKQTLCHQFFLSGNMSALARTYQVDYKDLLELSKEGWWQETIKNLHREELALTKVKMAKIQGRVLDELALRVEEGDKKWVPLGGEKGSSDYGFKQIPLTGRDLAVIASMIYEKKKDIEERGGLEQPGEAKKLADLAEALRYQRGRAVTIQDGEIVGEGKE
jgi:hypothetical protein